MKKEIEKEEEIKKNKKQIKPKKKRPIFFALRRWTTKRIKEVTRHNK